MDIIYGDSTITFITTYTADEEEPKCHRCKHVCDDQSICDACGRWWKNYIREKVETLTYEEYKEIMTKDKKLDK